MALTHIDTEAATPRGDGPLRIWQVCESYPPKYGGGAAMVARDISHALAARGHEVQVLTTESRPDADYTSRSERDGDIQVERINLRYLVDQDPEGWQLGMRAWRRHERRIAELIEQRLLRSRPDIVHYHTTRPFGEIAPQVVARHGVPVVAMLHDAWFLCGRMTLARSPVPESCSGPGPVKCLECMYSHYDGNHRRALTKLAWRVPRLGVYPAYRLWKRRAARRVLSGAIGHSHFIVDLHESRVGGATTYVPLGINLDGVPPRPPKRPRRPFRFGFFGGFAPVKGIWHVLDAAATLRREGLEFELHIWGPDQDTAVMATTVAETFPCVPLEARAVGAPTIAPAIGGLLESVQDEVNGLLFAFGDPRDLERQMRRVLTEEGLFERLIDGLEPVIDVRTRGEALATAYRSILADHAGSTRA